MATLRLHALMRLPSLISTFPVAPDGLGSLLACDRDQPAIEYLARCIFEAEIGSILWPLAGDPEHWIDEDALATPDTARQASPCADAWLGWNEECS